MGVQKTRALAAWPSLQIAGPVVNFSCFLLGSGWASMALTASQMGLIVAVGSILVLGLSNAYACIVMLQAAEEFGTPESYHNLTEEVLGVKWALLLDAFVVISGFFSCTQKLILVGDFGVAIKHRLITHAYLPNRALIVLVLTAVLATPLVYIRRIRTLEKTSTGGVLCTLTALAILTYTYVVSVQTTNSAAAGEVVYANPSPDLLLALPVQQYVFAGQTGVIPLYREMKNRSLRNGKIMVCVAFSICLGVNILFGVLGYLQYPGALEGNFFTLYEDKDGVLYTALFFIAILGVISAYPLTLTVTRIHLANLVLRNEQREKPKWIYALATFVLAGSLGVALGIQNVGVVQGVAGGIGNSFVNLVVPGFALLKLVDTGQKHEQDKRFRGSRCRAPAGSLGTWVDDSGADSKFKVAPEELGRTAPYALDAEAGQGKGKDARRNSRQGLVYFKKLPAYGLFALAALQAGLATFGNLVSLVLVGWDNASSTFSKV